MKACCLLISTLLISSCGSQEYRLGNHHDDPYIMNKRDNERDRQMRRHNKARVKTAKHYIKEYKSHDGDLNLFRRDGFDFGF